MPQKELGPYVRETLITRHGTLAFAAERLGISYERLKKAIQRNRFSAPDLEVLLPESRYEELKRDFHFNFSRRQSPGDKTPISSGEFDLFAKLELSARSFQKGVRETNLNEFITDLYEKIGTDSGVQSMVLFCHESSQPVEWRTDQIQLLKQLSNAIVEGATIIYVMEIDLENTVTPKPIEEDNIDRHFRRHLERLKSLCDDPPGFVALIRVPRCSFCIPYQKPALFTRYDVLPEHYALTTVELPERIDGRGSLGTAILPQRDEVALAMRDYIFDLVAHLKDPDATFHFQSYPALKSPAELIAKLQPIIEL